MASINPQFQLSNPKATGETSINLVFYYGRGNRFFYSTGKKINPKYWDGDEQRVKRARLDERTKRKHNRINSEIEDIIGEVDNLFDRYERDRIIPTKQTIKAGLDKRFKAHDSGGTMNMIQLAEKIIEDSRSGTRLTKHGTKISEVTIKGYNTTLQHLIKFYKQARYPMNLDDINMAFYKSFIKYFHKKKMSTNTVGKNVKNVKVFMKEAYKLNLTQNKIFENEDFTVMEEATDQIYLTMDELQIIFELDLTNNKRLDRVRDLFIIDCFTGLRFGDLEGLGQDNIIDDGKMIKLRMKKTGGLVIIPLLPIARAVLVKYSGTPPPLISNQKFNEYLKELGKNAGIDEPVTRSITKGGMRVDTTSPKYKLITVHTARRSFATNMFLHDVPTISIMMITGHKTEKSFLKYIRISEEENAKKLMQHKFFSGDTQLKIAQ